MAMPSYTVKNKTVFLLKFGEGKNLIAWQSSPWEFWYLSQRQASHFVLESEDEGQTLSCVSVS